NLLGNAIKFTDRGSVRIVVRLDRWAPSGPTIAFDVIDTGVGMSDDQIAHLFEPFSRAERARESHPEGTGLGLAISKRLAELLGGSISVRSVPGGGSTFGLSLPTGPLGGVRLLTRPDEAVAPKPEAPPPPAATRLVP